MVCVLVVLGGDSPLIEIEALRWVGYPSTGLHISESTPLCESRCEIRIERLGSISGIVTWYIGFFNVVAEAELNNIVVHHETRPRKRKRVD